MVVVVVAVSDGSDSSTSSRRSLHLHGHERSTTEEKSSEQIWRTNVCCSEKKISHTWVDTLWRYDERFIVTCSLWHESRSLKIKTYFTLHTPPVWAKKLSITCKQHMLNRWCSSRSRIHQGPSLQGNILTTNTGLKSWLIEWNAACVNIHSLLVFSSCLQNPGRFRLRKSQTYSGWAAGLREPSSSESSTVKRWLWRKCVTSKRRRSNTFANSSIPTSSLSSKKKK